MAKQQLGENFIFSLHCFVIVCAVNAKHRRSLLFSFLLTHANLSFFSWFSLQLSVTMQFLRFVFIQLSLTSSSSSPMAKTKLGILFCEHSLTRFTMSLMEKQQPYETRRSICVECFRCRGCKIKSKTNIYVNRTRRPMQQHLYKMCISSAAISLIIVTVKRIDSTRP